MNKLAIILGVATLVTLAAIMTLNGREDASGVDYEAEFRAFSVQFGKEYLSFGDRAYRLEVFRRNLDFINGHNSQKGSTYTLGVNEFADLTEEEFAAFYLTDFSEAGNVTAEHCEQPKKNRRGIPESVDWEAKEKVQAIKSQGRCGSCWAFSAIAALESAYSIKTDRDPPELSEQELVDCSGSYGNRGCQGGFMHYAFNYIIDHNINRDWDYPYEARDHSCQTPTVGKGKFGISKCIRAEPSVDGLKNAIVEAPISVALLVTGAFRFYRAGILNPEGCDRPPNHAVLAVGYDESTDPPMFRAKNSWGINWGEDGYFRIAQGKGAGTCSIAGNGYNFYPIAA